MTVPGLKLAFLGPPQIELAGRCRDQPAQSPGLIGLSGRYGPATAPRHIGRPALARERTGRRPQSPRRDLSELNLALGGHWLETERERICLHPGFQLDVMQFQQHLDACAANPAVCSHRLEQAVTLYRSDFLSGFTLTDSPAFDEWQFFQAEALRQACASALERLVVNLEDNRRDEQAIACARRWAALDPLHEPAHRKLMQLYVQTGQQAAALRQFERCREILSNELGVPPSADTTLLFNQIRERRVEFRDDNGTINGGYACIPRSAAHPDYIVYRPTTGSGGNSPLVARGTYLPAVEFGGSRWNRQNPACVSGRHANSRSISRWCFLRRAGICGRVGVHCPGHCRSSPVHLLRRYRPYRTIAGIPARQEIAPAG